MVVTYYYRAIESLRHLWCDTNISQAQEDSLADDALIDTGC